MKICIIKVGNIVEAVIEIVLLGRGKDIAMEVAQAFGFRDCGCDRRKEWLNRVFGCPQQDIKIKL